jgi:hypothetical protein
MKKKLQKLLSAVTTIILLSGSVSAQSNIDGLVLYHLKANKPIPSVNLNLIDAGGAVVATATTNLNGAYSFTNVPYGLYTITATTSITPGGITMGDAFLMFLHLCNIYPFTPIQELAADVDGDGTVTWDDYWTVVIGWFVQGYPFPTGPWVFEDVIYAHTGTKANPPTMGGSSAGDVNGTFVPSTRDIVAIQTSYTDKYAENKFSVEIYANEITETSAMGLVINYPSTMIDVSNVSCQLGETNMSITNGQIRISWINQSAGITTVDPNLPILVIDAEKNNSFDGSDIRFIIDPVSHFSDYKGELIYTSYTLPLISNAGSYLSNNCPNPFNGSTKIIFTLPAQAKVNISLFNQQGQIVRVISDAVENAGTHKITFDSKGLESGVYYYTLKTAGNVSINETKKMVITR